MLNLLFRSRLKDKSYNTIGTMTYSFGRLRVISSLNNINIIICMGTYLGTYMMLLKIIIKNIQIFVSNIQNKTKKTEKIGKNSDYL